MLKKITFSFLAILLICSFSIFAFAEEYTFDVSAGSVQGNYNTTLNSLPDSIRESILAGDVVNIYFNGLIDGFMIDRFKVYSDGTDVLCVSMFSGILYDNLSGAFSFQSQSISIASDALSEADCVTVFETVFPDIELPFDSPSDSTESSELPSDTSELPSDTSELPDPPDSSFTSGVFAIFNEITTWITGVLIVVVSLFWANGSLTFFGILALVALCIAIFFLLVRLLQNFLHFRS